MDTKGNIRRFASENEARKAGFTEQLTEYEARHLAPMNRKRRRAELKRLRGDQKRKSKERQRGV